MVGISYIPQTNNDPSVIWKLVDINGSTSYADNEKYMPFYIISNDIIQPYSKTDVPEYMSVVQKYDDHVHGSYVVNGLTVSVLNDEATLAANQYMFNIKEGIAHVNGIEVNKGYSERLVVDQDVDYGTHVGYRYSYIPSVDPITQEEITYPPSYLYEDQDDNVQISLPYSPISNIIKVRKYVHATTSITVSAQVTQNNREYDFFTEQYYNSHQTVDPNAPDVLKVYNTQNAFVKGDGGFNQSSGGFGITLSTDAFNTFGNGQTVFVDFICMQDVDASELQAIRNSLEIDNETRTSTITLDNVIRNTAISTTYQYKMPRIDLIVMSTDGSFNRVKGISNIINPQPPATPPASIKLAQVYNHWHGLPDITNEAIQVIKMDQLNQINTHITNLYSLIAKNELRFEVLSNAPSTTYGVFVDPFTDDSMRDYGYPQTAVVSDQMLQLPMAFEAYTFPTNKSVMLDYTNEEILSQYDYTGSININPYQAFNDVPIQVTLTPAVDRWVEEEVIVKYIGKYLNYNQAMKKYGYSWKSKGWNTNYKYYNSEDIAKPSTSTTETIEDDLRELTINIKASGFQNNQPGIKVYFDGIQVETYSTEDLTTATNTADTEGSIDFYFKIPSGIPNGTKLVRVVGEYNGITKEGNAYYVGTHEYVTTINYYYRYQLDPVAQTFKVNENRLVSGVRFFLTHTDTSDVKVEIREVSNGFPTTTTLAACTIPYNDSRLQTANKWVEAIFDTPVFLYKDIDYCITILCNTPNYSVGIAKLGTTRLDDDGKTESALIGKTVTAQPYDVGVLLSSSNATTWTAHQDQDLTFELLGAKFSKDTNNTYTKTITCNTLDLTGVTDLIPLMEVESTSANTDAQMVITKIPSSSSESETIVTSRQAWQSIALDSILNGNYRVDLLLRGEEKYSPIVSRDPQLVVGKLQNEGQYISKAFKCGTNKKVRLIVDVYEPANSTVTISILTSSSGSYSNATHISSLDEYLIDGWYSRTYECDCDLAQTRIRVLLKKENAYAVRPCVANLSAMILDR